MVVKEIISATYFPSEASDGDARPPDAQIVQGSIMMPPRRRGERLQGGVNPTNEQPLQYADKTGTGVSDHICPPSPTPYPRFDGRLGGR